MAVRLERCRAIANVFVKHLELTTHRPVPDARYFVSMSQSIQSPEAPKMPARPFLKFRNKKSSEIRENNPGASVGEISKIASQLWKELGPEVKIAYRLLAQEEYRDYKQKYLVFLDGLSEQEKAQLHDGERAKMAFLERLRDKQELHDLGKPKQPPNAYMAFVRSSLHKWEGVSGNYFKVIADTWHNIPKEEKEIYEKDAMVEREKYKKELEEWEKKMIEIGREDVVRKSSLAKAKRTSVSKVAKKSSSSSGQMQKTVLVSPASRRKVTKQSHMSGE